MPDEKSGDDKSLNVAFVSSKKVGSAVKRNRARRRLKGLFLSYEDKVKSGKYIFVAKEKIHERDFVGLKKDFDFAFRRLELFK